MNVEFELEPDDGSGAPALRHAAAAAGIVHSATHFAE